MNKSKEITLSKNKVLIIGASLVALAIILLLAYLWHSQVQELKDNQSTSNQQIQDLQAQVSGSKADTANVALSERESVEKFVKDFYNDCIKTVKKQQGKTSEEADPIMRNLEKGKVTADLKKKLDQPQDNDPFFCVHDPVMEVSSVSATKLNDSYTIQIKLKVGDQNDNSEVVVSANVIKTDSGFQFNSLTCIY